jgi:hypothetical protein
MGPTGRVTDQVARLNPKDLVVPRHLSRSCQDKVELFLGVAVSMQADAGPGRQLCQVDKVTVTRQATSLDDSNETNKPVTSVRADSSELKVVEVAAIEERFLAQERRTQVGWTCSTPNREEKANRKWNQGGEQDLCLPTNRHGIPLVHT